MRKSKFVKMHYITFRGGSKKKKSRGFYIPNVFTIGLIIFFCLFLSMFETDFLPPPKWNSRSATAGNVTVFL